MASEIPITKDAPVDLFEALITRLELAVHADDHVQVVKALDPAGIPFHRLATGHATLWDRYFALVTQLLYSEHRDIARRAEHFLKLGLWYERPESLSQRLQGMLAAIRGRFVHDPELLLRVTDYLYFQRDISPDYVGLLDDLERETDSARLPPGVVLSARIAYVYPRISWDQARSFLFSSLDHPDALVRAYAAHVLGGFYHNAAAGSLSPTLGEIIGTITEKEIERPGIAGPLMADYYSSMDLDRFEQDSGLDCKAWLLDILRRRQGPEPDLQPCCNGIDFFSHELFGTPAELKMLVQAGALWVAVESAGDHGIDIKTLLLETETDDPDILRELSGYLARDHRTLDPRGVARNFVKVVDHRPDVDLFLINFDDDSRHRTVVVFPKASGGHLTRAMALDWVDRVLPVDRRGTVVRTEPWDTPALEHVAVDYPWTTITYANGAVVELRGSNRDQRWESVAIGWKVPLALWNPEAC